MTDAAPKKSTEAHVQVLGGELVITWNDEHRCIRVGENIQHDDKPRSKLRQRVHAMQMTTRNQAWYMPNAPFSVYRGKFKFHYKTSVHEADYPDIPEEPTFDGDHNIDAEFRNRVGQVHVVI